MDVERPARVELRYSGALLRRVVNRWWIRTVGPWLGCGLALFGAPLAFGLAHADRSWVVGALGTATLILLLSAQQIRAAHLRHAMEKMRRLRDGKLVLTVSPEGLLFESASGSMFTPWHEVAELRVEQDCWLLLRAPNDFSTLPLAGIDPAMQRCLLGKFREAGVRVRRL